MAKILNLFQIMNECIGGKHWFLPLTPSLWALLSADVGMWCVLSGLGFPSDWNGLCCVLIHFWVQCAINQSMLILVKVREKTALASGHISIKSVTEGKTLDIFHPG